MDLHYTCLERKGKGGRNFREQAQRNVLCIALLFLLFLFLFFFLLAYDYFDRRCFCKANEMNAVIIAKMVTNYS
jgi:hypothetical protein